MYSTAMAYFDNCARPLYDRFLLEQAPASFWATAVSLHHVADYFILDTERPTDRKSHADKVREFVNSNADLDRLRIVADALKHSTKWSGRRLIARADSAVEDAGILAMQNILDAPNILDKIFAITIEDQCCLAVRPILDRAFEFWSEKFMGD